MPRIYTAVFTGDITTAGGDVDLFSFQPADDKPILLRGFLLSQLSEIGDAQEEGLRITVRRMTATVTIGSGGTALTAATPLRNAAEPVWGFTARANDTTVTTTTGTNQIVKELGWNVRNTPLDFWYPEEDFCVMARQTEAIVIRCETIVADTMSLCLTAWVQEA